MTDTLQARWRETGDGVQYWYEFRAAKDHPCARCPWLTENHDAKEQALEADGAYLPATRADIWSQGRRSDGGNIGCAGEGDFYSGGLGLVDGAHMACHTRREEQLLEPAGIPSLRVCECTGARVLLDRELIRYVQAGASALSARGARAHAAVMLGRDRALFDCELDGLDWRELVQHASPALLDPRVRFEGADPPSERERADWATAVAAVA